MPRQLGTEEPSATLWKVGVHCSDRLTNVPGILFDTKFCSRPNRALNDHLQVLSVCGVCLAPAKLTAYVRLDSGLLAVRSAEWFGPLIGLMDLPETG